MTPEPNAPGTQTPEQVRQAFKDSLLEGLRDQVKTDVRTGVDEATNVFNEKMAEFESRMADYEARSRAGYVAGSHEGGNEKMDMGRVVKSLVMRAEGVPTDQWRAEAPFEWEASDAAWTEMRAQGTAPDSSGGFLVPGQFFDDQIIPLLRPKLIAQELGAMDLPVTSTPVEIPREGTAPVVEALAENEGQTSTDVEFGMIRGEPHTAQSFIKSSRRFLTMGTGADVFLRRRMTDEIAIEINRWALKGSGVANEPIGILNAAGVGTVTNTASFELASTYASLIEMEGQVDDANALSEAGSLGFAFANAGFRALRQIQTAALPSVQFSRILFSDGAETAIIGHPFRNSTQLTGGGTTTEVIFGDWSKMVIPRWGTVVVEASNTANDALQRRQTHIVAYMDVDVMITQPTAFSTWTDGDSTGF
jgi:HK97 family phage major capsid protein